MPRSSTDSPFTEIDRLGDPDNLGLVAPITIKTKPNGYVAFSFAIFKEFERPGGDTQRTSYLNDCHIDAAHKLLGAIEKRIEIERDRVWAERRGYVANAWRMNCDLPLEYASRSCR